MKPGDIRIDVQSPPLSDTRWESIEARVFERLDAKPLGRRHIKLRPMFLIAAAFLLVAGGALGARRWLRPSPPESHPTARGVSQINVGNAKLDVVPGAVVGFSHETVSLEIGSVECDVPSRSADQEFMLTTPHARVQTDSGNFRVDVSANQTSVIVKSGHVRAQRHDEQATDVGAGTSWSSLSSSSAMVQQPVPTTTTSLKPPVHSASSAKVGPSQQERFELAEGLERSDPERALAEYHALANTGGSWADNALFAEGRLQADRGQHENAKALLREYLVRCPTGPNAVDARALLERQR